MHDTNITQQGQTNIAIPKIWVVRVAAVVATMALLAVSGTRRAGPSHHQDPWEIVMTFWKTLRWIATIGFLLLLLLAWLYSAGSGDSPPRDAPPLRTAPTIVR